MRHDIKLSYCRVLQPYTKEELKSMHQQGNSDLGMVEAGDKPDNSMEKEALSRHDKVFVPQLGWVDQSEVDLQGMLH